MKHLKYFREAVIIPKSVDLSGIKTFDDLQKWGEKNNVDIVRYKEFINSIPEEYKKAVPPKDTPIFGLFHPVRKKPMIVTIFDEFNDFKLEFLEGIITHERVHVEQDQKSNIEPVLPDINSMKKYFSDKNEIMAFSWNFAKKIFENTENIEEAKKAVEFMSTGHNTNVEENL